MKTFLVILVIAAAGYWAWRHNYIKPEWIGLGGSGPAASSAGSAPESLQATLNRGLPRMVSNDLSLDRVSANDLAVSFNYRLVDLDQFAATQRYGSSMPAEMQNDVVRDLCGNRALRDQVIARGREVQIQVHSQDGRTVFNSQLRPGGC